MSVAGRLATSDAELTLLAILCRHPSFFHEIEEEIGILAFADENHDQLRQALIGALSGHDATTFEELWAALPDDALRVTVHAALDDPFVRRHRLISTASSLEEIRATWRENASLLRRSLNTAEPATTMTGDITDAVLTKRFARRRATLDEQEKEQADNLHPNHSPRPQK